MEYRIFTGKSEAHKAFNSLVGIIDGISIDSTVNDKEVKELEAWCNEHEFLANRNPFNDLITNIQVIISDNRVTLEEIEDMKWLCEKFEDGFDYYDRSTSDLQKLQGICHGILSDGKVQDDEIIQLNSWLDSHVHLKSYFPYDEISSILTDVLSDGIIDNDERLLLKKYFNEFVNLNDSELSAKIIDDTKDIQVSGICSVDPSITVQKKQFCFTGKSDRSSRAEIIDAIERRQGTYVNSVSSKTDFLIVGDGGNPCWSYACYGRKVEKAIKLRKDGSNLQIVHENDFWDELENI